MNHLKVYESIIENVKSKNRIKLKRTDINYVYYERHHIIPKCMKGSNNKDNLVLLTAREHYICHKLLTYIHKGNYRIMAAFHRMTFDKKGKHHISSKDYNYAKELRAMIPVPKEQREKISKKLKNRKLPKETCKKMSEAKRGIPIGKGRKLSKQHIINRSLAQRGRKNTIESNKKIRENMLKTPKILCEHCNRTFYPWSLAGHKKSKRYINETKIKEE